jgi:signal transduction histidine kinase
LQHERLLARQARLAAIGEMISAIAHQWRQPLTTLGVVIQSIKIAWEQRLLDRPFLVQAVENARKQIDHMSNTIEDFRNFFNPDKVVDNFDVREKIAEVVQLVSAQFTTAGVRLDVADSSGGVDLIIKGYQNEFKQSVLNLVSNSFDAVITKYGAPDSTSHNAGTVLVSIGRADDMVIIEVKDNGCGIPAEYAEKIFEPYFTTKQDGKGTGIGLYMTKLIIEESMGGHLSFTSSTDETVFRIVMASGALLNGKPESATPTRLRWSGRPLP